MLRQFFWQGCRQSTHLWNFLFGSGGPDIILEKYREHLGMSISSENDRYFSPGW